MAQKEILYTICPVANATYLAANHGFLEKGLGEIGYQPVKLQTLSKDKWPAHFTYENDRLFREGGNTPPIWAKSKGRGVVLIGINIIEEKQSILVRADSDIRTVEDLKGKRLAIPAHTNVHIDFHKATAEQGFEIALEANGISKDEVTWVTVVNPNSFTSEGKGGNFDHLSKAEIDALSNGEVDAIFEKLPIVEQLLATGKYRKLYDVAYDQQKQVPVNNEYPNVLTVSSKLAEEEPEVVVEFLKQTILAARWAVDHRQEAEKLLAEQTYGTVEEYQKSYADNFYQRLEPNFSEAGLQALQKRADFLYEHGYLESRVDVYEWADDSFLKKALAELDN
jgi:2'-hydroxybiphenyl-2-sulfinate desulfinase